MACVRARVRACGRVRLRGRLSVRGCASRWAGGEAHAWGVGDWVRSRAGRGERWLGAQRIGGSLDIAACSEWLSLAPWAHHGAQEWHARTTRKAQRTCQDKSQEIGGREESRMGAPGPSLSTK